MAIIVSILGVLIAFIGIMGIAKPGVLVTWRQGLFPLRLLRRGSTRFPAEKLMVAGTPYFTATGPLETSRETQSHLNTAVGRGEGSDKETGG